MTSRSVRATEPAAVAARMVSMSTGATQDSSHPQHELLDEKRFGQVVVGAELQTEDAVGVRATRGEEEDGDPVSVGAQLPADLEAVDPRQHDVEDQQIGVGG